MRGGRGATARRDRNPEQYAQGTLAFMVQDRPFEASISVNWVAAVYTAPSGFGRLNYGKLRRG